MNFQSNNRSSQLASATVLAAALVLSAPASAGRYSVGPVAAQTPVLHYKGPSHVWVVNYTEYSNNDGALEVRMFNGSSAARLRYQYFDEEGALGHEGDMEIQPGQTSALNTGSTFFYNADITVVISSDQPLVITAFSRSTYRKDNQTSGIAERNVPVNGFECPNTTQSWLCSAYRVHTPW